MSRLVVVSNRVAVPGENRAGGLAVALQAALQENGGLWFGWSGRAVRGESGTIHEQNEGDIRYVTLDINRRDFDAYYNGFANRTLWPLLHFRLDLVDYDRDTREGYARVNALFAETLAPQLRDSDTLWIHDYHLIPLAALLRERGDAKMRPDLPAQDIRDWFRDRLPATLAAENAYLATLDPAAAKAERARFWTAVPLTGPEETAFLAAHGPELVPLMTARAVAMLDRQEWAQAERLRRLRETAGIDHREPHQSTPLVLGSPAPSRRNAWRSARATALNIASILW